MPLVLVRYNRENCPPEAPHSELAQEKRKAHRRTKWFYANITSIAASLPAIIAEALTVPGHPEAALLETDISVEVSPSGPFDQNVVDLSIVIFANDYPERRENLSARKEAIAAKVREIVPTRWEVSIWIRLAYGEYVFLPKT